MPARSTPRIILLDIEGTVAPISFVHEVLFPYARLRMESYLRDHWEDPAVSEARATLDASGDFSESTLASLKTSLFQLMDADVKSTGLKQLQGLIWDEGYRGGKFQSPIFADVAPALKRWTQRGKLIAIYSSGSVAAQKVFFGHTVAGDLTGNLSAYFDTATGPKRSTSSYRAIASALKASPADILFISDVLEESQAAQAAGLAGMIARRPGNAVLPPGNYAQIETFDELD